jgi:anti-sigma regulatory factor (Ser/Thr protein kinase)
MNELSLHILDIAQNSITAGANLVEIVVTEDILANTLSISITDNGKGMSKEFLKKVRDPFTTTRTTRGVGMGISLFESAALSCDGIFDIISELGVGTKVIAQFLHNHIDRQPLGNIAETITTLIFGNPTLDFVYKYNLNGGTFEFDTRLIKETLSGAPIDTFEVILWIKEYINEGMEGLY